MPRPRRVHLEEGALYLVTSRALEGKLLFEDRTDYEVFLSFLKEYQAQFGFKLFSYVLSRFALKVFPLDWDPRGKPVG